MQEHAGLEPFRIEVRGERDTVRVTPVGELDIATVDQIDGQLRVLRDAGSPNLTLDLRELTFADSTLLSLALRWATHKDADGPDFSLIEGSPHIQRLFELSGTRDRLPFRAAQTPHFSLI